MSAATSAATNITTTTTITTTRVREVFAAREEKERKPLTGYIRNLLSSVIQDE